MTQSQAMAEARAWVATRVDKFNGVYWGYKRVGGQLTDTPCVVFVVPRKLPDIEVAEADRVPRAFANELTDVIQATYRALALTERRRPCPAGYSVGHQRITAGTFGLPVKRGDGTRWLCLSNNHVLADSNSAVIGDWVRQPGTADGGTDNDRWARLTEFVRINFEGAGGKKNAASSATARAYWGAFKSVGNAGARLVGCPNRLQVSIAAVDQPKPNLVDAAVATPLSDDWLAPVVESIGAVAGIRDLALGDAVEKVGRTTERTQGRVVGVDGAVRVSFGAAGEAQFDDQIIIESTTGGEFSAGGDSGSAILTTTGASPQVGGLLFAGGDGQTIANKFSHVAALLGVRVG